MQDKRAIDALVNIFNPLPVVEAGDELEISDLVRLLCPPVVDVVQPTALIERYKMISSIATEPFMLPPLPILVEKVVSPLIYSKVAFVAGNPLGTIALCGFVAEMIALLLYEMAHDDGLIADVAKDEFEGCLQKKRVRILYDRSIIDQKTKSAFDLIRDVRDRYLHLISEDHSFVFDDALRVYARSISLLVGLVGQEFRNGAWVPKPSFARYLRKRGLL